MKSVYLPNYSLGQDALDGLAKKVSEIGSKAFIIGGKTALEVSLEKIKSKIVGSSVEIVGVEVYGHECTFANVDRLKEIALANKCDVIIGVGGGKAVDTAKATADKLGFDIVTVPTIASNCASISALSVVYKEDGSLDSIYHFEKPVYHCFMDSDFVINAPYKFLRAGICDTIAKHYECCLASRDDELAHSDALGRTISSMCVEPLLKYAKTALKDLQEGNITPALEEAILAIVVSTGLVSILVHEKYNGAIAHPVFYGFTKIPRFEEFYLHGDVVAYGVLVQLVIEGKMDEFNKIRNFLIEIGGITKLAQMEIELDREKLQMCFDGMFACSDIQYMAIETSPDEVFKAFETIEAVK